MSAQLGPRLPLARAKLSDADAVLAFAAAMGTIASGAIRQQRTRALLKRARGALEFFASVFNPYSFPIPSPRRSFHDRHERAKPQEL